MSSFGSGGQLIGANANQLLGMPTALQQQSPSSAGFQPGLMPPPMSAPPTPQSFQAPSMPSIPGSAATPPQMPMAAPQMPLGQPAQPQGGVVGIPPGNPEAAMIIKSLSKRLDSLTKGEEMARGQQ